MKPNATMSKSNCMRITIEVSRPMAARTGNFPLMLIGEIKTPLR
jgi:hypothetical protein